MWEISGGSVLGALVLGFLFGFAFTVGAKVAGALFGPKNA